MTPEEVNFAGAIVGLIGGLIGIGVAIYAGVVGIFKLGKQRQQLEDDLTSLQTQVGHIKEVVGNADQLAVEVESVAQTVDGVARRVVAIEGWAASAASAIVPGHAADS